MESKRKERDHVIYEKMQTVWQFMTILASMHEEAVLPAQTE